MIGDLHGAWSDFDAAYLNGSDYDGVLFVGDLGRGEDTTRRIARQIEKLDPPTLVLPGNADAPHAAVLNAEFSLRRGLDQLFDADSDPVLQRQGMNFEGVRLCGYSLHRPGLAALDFTIVSGRPYSRGGPELTFEDELRSGFGIASLADSASRLVELVDQAETDTLLFLSHNGPRGLGDRPNDPWGCDFRPDPADWGDPDLEVAIDHARRQGRRVLAVVAGHMHLRIRDRDEERRWRHRKDDILYVNPARVPRIGSREGREWYHHVALTLRAEGAEAEEVFVEA